MGIVKEKRKMLVAGETVPVTSAAINAAVAAKAEVVALTAIATADATDLTTAVALVNACKASINAIIAALKA